MQYECAISLQRQSKTAHYRFLNLLPVVHIILSITWLEAVILVYFSSYGPRKTIIMYTSRNYLMTENYYNDLGTM